MKRAAPRSWVRHVAVGGIVAGATFGAFQLAVAGASGGASTPVRLIATIAVGGRALQPSYPLIDAARTATAIHLVLSVVFALIFMAIAQPRPSVRSPGIVVLKGSLFGAILWIVNFYVLAPVLEWTWFADRTRPLVQWMAHTFFFGAVLGTAVSRYAVIGPPYSQADGPPPHEI
jgi:hypothetical protein